MSDCPHGGDPLLCPPCQDGVKPNKVRAPRRSGIEAGTVMTAKYDGRCGRCDEPVMADFDRIHLHDEYGWVHAHH